MKRIICIILSLTSTLLYGGGETIVERSPFLKHPGFLGTGDYIPLSTEAVFYQKLPEAGRKTVSGFNDSERAFFKSAFFLQNNPNATPESIKAQEPVFSLAGHVGEYVSWFGILRKVEQNGSDFLLTLQNKYSTGMSDLHIQTVSLWGAGDFEAVVRSQDLDLLPLILVRVYGKIVQEDNGLPVVEVEFLRYWNWLYFNFSDYGEDKKLSAYDKHLDLSGVRIYSARVDPYYYPKRIQATNEQLDHIAHWIRTNGDAINIEHQEAQKEESK